MRDGQAAKTAAGVAKLLQKPVNGLKSLRKMERAKGFEAAKNFQPFPSGNSVFIHTPVGYHTQHRLARAKTCEDFRTVFVMLSHEITR